MTLSDERLAEIRSRDVSLGRWPELWADDARPAYRATADRRVLLAAYDEQRAEVERLRAQVEDQKVIADSFKQAAIDIAAQYQAEIDTLWKALNAATSADEGGDHAR